MEDLEDGYSITAGCAYSYNSWVKHLIRSITDAFERGQINEDEYKERLIDLQKDLGDNNE